MPLDHFIGQHPWDGAAQLSPPRSGPLILGVILLGYPLPHLDYEGEPTPAPVLTDQMSDLGSRNTTHELKGRITGPVRLIEQIARAWSLSSLELAELLAYPNETLVENLMSGRL